MKISIASACYLLLPALAGALFASPEGDDQSKLRRVVDSTYEKSIYAKINVSSAMVYVNKVSDSEVFAGEFFFNEKPPLVDYEIVGDEGRLSIKFTDKHNKEKYEDYSGDYNVEIDDLYENECYLNFSDRIPLSLNMDLGVIKGDWDLGGLKIEDCDIVTAVSSATIDFTESNKIMMDDFEVENGVGKLKMYNLCNANFNDLRFEGEIGSYVLDFGGELKQDVTVSIEVGLGKLAVYLPTEYPVRIHFDDSFLTSLDIDDAYKKGDYYYNDRWGEHDGPSLDVEIDASLAKVDIKWLD